MTLNNLVDIHSHHHVKGQHPAIYSIRIGMDSALCEQGGCTTGLFSAGIHPWDSGNEGVAGATCVADKVGVEGVKCVEGNSGMSKLAQLTACADKLTAIGSKLVAIGEIGLDYATKIEITTQQKVFKAQLAIAQELELPVIIHCVKAYDDLLLLLDGFAQPIIIHGFTGSSQLAERVLGHGCYLSFGARSFDSPKTIEALRATPIERLFLETDTSEADIADIYLRASQITGTEIESLKMNIYRNYNRVFGV